MATYVNDLRLKEIATGDEAGTWGTSTNTNLQLIGEALGYGTQDCFASDADATTTVADGATDPARAMYFKVTSSATLTATRTLTIAPNTVSRVMLIENATTGSQSIAISQGSGGNVTIASGQVKMVYLDGAGAGGAVVDAMASLELGTITVANLTATTADINGGTIDGVTIGGSSAGAGTFSGLTVGAATGITLDTAGTNEASWTHTAGTGSSVINVGRNSTWGGDLTIQTDTKNRLNIESSGDISFYEDTGTTPKFFWDASEESLGVGTTSLVGAGSPLVTRGTTTGKGFVSDNGSNAGFIIQYASGLTSIGQDFNAPLAFLTNNTERMRIDSSGNLGLGVVPSAWGSGFTVLQIGSGGGVYSANNDRNIYLNQNCFYDGSNFKYIASDYAGISGFEDGAYKWLQAPSGTAGNTISFTQAMTLDASGNVGIGTSSPGVSLHVDASGGGAIRASRSSVSANYIQMDHDGTNGTVRASGANALIFDTNSAERMRIDSSGLVAIGTSSPVSTAQLTVGGTSRIAPVSGNGLLLASGGSDRMFISTAGDVGIGTSSPVANTPLTLQGASGYTDTLWLKSAGTNIDSRINITPTGTGLAQVNNSNGTPIAFQILGSEKVRIDSSGTLQIGTFSGNNVVQISAGTTGVSSLYLGDGSSGAASYAGFVEYNHTGDYLRLGTGSTERARIDSSGNFFVGVTAQQGGGAHCIQAGTGVNSLQMQNNGASPYGPYINFSAATPNNTVNYFIACADSTASRAILRSNGGLLNYQSNNADLSDIRTKKDIAPAPSYWDKIGALEIVTYKYNDQSHDDVNVGVIAQQVETVEPVWVDNDGFGETPEGEEPLKTVYTKDITFAAIKALQEAMARIETLEAEVAALKGA